MEKKRGSFSGGIGFVLAAAGSAVGLGNLWRFPYLAAQYGGGIFILTYIVLALTFGFALLTTEIAIGRKTGLSPVMAYKKLSKKFSFVGILAVIVPVIIMPYYCVIGGWVTKYVAVYAEGLFNQGMVSTAAGEGFFGGFIGNPNAPLVFFLVFLMITVLVVMCGVEKGIERLSKFLMPILLVLTVGIAIYVMTLPNALDGVKYYLVPDFSKFSFSTIAAAASQLFYSMSLAMGIMITYGSYTKKEVSIVKSVNRIEIFDTSIAMLAGLMVIPAVYAFSGEAGLTANGPGLMFQALPGVFNQMPFGGIIGLLFFVLVFFAALTSSISIMEAIVSSIMDKFHLSRFKSGLIVIGICLLLGIPSSLGNGLWANIKVIGMDFLTFFDFLSNSVLMPIVAFFTCILVGWIVKTKTITDEVTLNGERFKRKGLYEVMVKYVAPVVLVMILVTGILSGFGIIKI